MKTYYLKATSKDELETAMKSAGLLVPRVVKDVTTYVPHQWILYDPVGTITEYVDKDTYITIPGYHANIYVPEGHIICITIEQKLSTFIIQSPTTPTRKLA